MIDIKSAVQLQKLSHLPPTITRQLTY